MKPSQVAAKLRAIASYIEKTPNPSQTKVASALRSVTANIRVAEVDPAQRLWDVSYSEAVVLEMFDGDKGRLSDAMMETSQLAWSQCKVMFLEPIDNGLRFQGTQEGIDAFMKLCEEADSERPDEDEDILMAAMSKSSPKDVTETHGIDALHR